MKSCAKLTQSAPAAANPRDADPMKANEPGRRLRVRIARDDALRDAANAASAAADEWWENLKARDRGEKLPELGPLPDYMISAIRKLA